MDKESFNQGNGICYVCNIPTLPLEDAFWHEACVHVDCLNNVGTGWIKTIKPDPLDFWFWLFAHWNGQVSFSILNGRFHLDLDPDRPLNDPLINVLDDSEWPEKEPDMEWEAAEAEYGENAIVYVGKGAGRKVNGGEDEVKVDK